MPQSTPPKILRNPKCTRCPLHETARQVCIPGDGPKNADILLVGQNPGREEDRKGKPFVGSSGKILKSQLTKAGFDAENYGTSKDWPTIRYTNAVRCITPNNREPTPAEAKACRPYLEEEIARVKPRYVVTAGGFATKGALKKAKISTAHGQFIDGATVTKDGHRFTGYPIYHPAAALRDPSKLTVIGQDLARLKRHVDGTLGKTQDDFNYAVVHTAEDLKRFWDLFDACEVFAYDTETSGLFVHGRDFFVRCIAFAMGFPRGIKPLVRVVPLQMPGSMYENEHNRQEAFLRVAHRKAAGKTAVSFHGKYDNNALRRVYGLRLVNAFDAMLAHHIIDENQDHDLKYVSRIELDCPEYDFPKKYFNMAPEAFNELLRGDPELRERYWEYNARDAWNTLHLHWKFNRLFHRNLKLRRLFYQLSMPSSAALEDIECEGLPLNFDRYNEVEARTRLECAASENKLNHIAGEKINWDSPDQVGRILFDKLGLPVRVKTPTGKPSTSEPAIVDLKGKHPVVNELLHFRELNKLLGTYLEGWKEYIVNGRLYLSYKQSGTVTGRFSSRLHQIPTDSGIRSVIDAMNAKRWEFVQIDLSQAELRIAAEMSRDLGLVDAYRNGRDVHWDTVLFMIGAGHMPEYAKHAIETASTLRPLRMRRIRTLQWALEALREAGIDKCVEVWKGWKEARTKAKRINFGFLYGMYENKFIEKAKVDYDWYCTWNQAHGFRQGFFELRPGLLDWHDRCKKLARLDGYVTNMFGRIRRLPAIHSTDKEARSEAERQAVNSPVQGTIGDWKSAGMVEINETIDKGQFRLCGEHHDALLGLVLKGQEDIVLPRVRQIMERPELLKTFKINMTVPMVADIAIGAWGAGRPYRDPN